MANTDYKSVDEYIESQPEAAQPVLNRVRSILRRTLPGAEEVISYQIPAYKLNGRVVIYFAGWKEHYSLYPAGERMAMVFQEKVAPYKLSKGTIRFPLSERIPAKLIADIAKFRAQEVIEREKTKASAPKKRQPAPS